MSESGDSGAGTFCHEAVFYEGDDGFLEATVPFIRAGVEAGEPVLVVVSDRKIRRLRRELGGCADHVEFADMAGVGRNPATIIPAWRAFVDRHVGGDRPLRGIGEPIWPGRTPDELVECHLHESLLNLAFAGPPAWWLVCPYDVSALDPAVIDEAQRTHPVVSRGGTRRRSTDYAGIPTAGLDTPLPPAPPDARVHAFRDRGLAEVRALVTAEAARAGIDRTRAAELVVAVNEVATNSIRYGGGVGTLRVWQEGASLVCEVTDHGQITNLLAGRSLPGEPSTGGYGLWLVNHICDLVQVRSSDDQGVIRLHMAVRG